MTIAVRARVSVTKPTDSNRLVHSRRCSEGKSNARVSQVWARSLHSTPLRGDILVGIQSKSSSGDIVHQKAGRRPIIVISPKEHIIDSLKVVCAPLSSTLPTDRISAFEPIIEVTGETGLSLPSKAMINQLFTTQIEQLKIKEVKKIGSARAYFPAIDNALKVVFDPNIQSKNPPFAQGDIVRFEENGFIADGIVISNDLGNKMSRIVMVSRVSSTRTSCGKHEIVVSLHHEKVKIDCQDIHTVNQLALKRIDHLPKKYMSQINEKLLQTVGIGRTS